MCDYEACDSGYGDRPSGDVPVLVAIVGASLANPFVAVFWAAAAVERARPWIDSLISIIAPR